MTCLVTDCERAALMATLLHLFIAVVAATDAAAYCPLPLHIPID